MTDLLLCSLLGIIFGKVERTFWLRPFKNHLQFSSNGENNRVCQTLGDIRFQYFSYPLYWTRMRSLYTRSHSIAFEMQSMQLNCEINFHRIHTILLRNKMVWIRHDCATPRLIDGSSDNLRLRIWCILRFVKIKLKEISFHHVCANLCSFEISFATWHTSRLV